MQEQFIKKCLCCGNTNLDETDVRCPICGFILPGITAGMDSLPESIRNDAIAYRKEKIGSISISLKIYYYENQDGQLKIREEKDFVLAPSAGELEPGVVKWLPQDFAGIDGGVPVKLGLSVGVQGVKKVYEADVKTPELDGLWHIGIELVEGFRFRVWMGNESINTHTGDMPLL